MNFEQLDLENRLYNPSKILYQQTSHQLFEFYGFSKSYLIDVHNAVATACLQLYKQPLETLNNWYWQTNQTATDIYLSFNQQWLPQATAYYQSLANNSNSFIIQAQTALTTFLDHPGQTANLLMDNLTVSANTSLATVSGYADDAILLLTEFLQNLSIIFTAIIDEPLLALDHYFIAIVSSLLDGYYQIVTSLLISGL